MKRLNVRSEFLERASATCSLTARVALLPDVVERFFIWCRDRLLLRLALKLRDARAEQLRVISLGLLHCVGECGLDLGEVELGDSFRRGGCLIASRRCGRVERPNCGKLHALEKGTLRVPYPTLPAREASERTHDLLPLRR